MGVLVEWLEANIKDEELIEWMAFFQLEPFGRAADDYSLGVLAKVINHKIKIRELFPGYHKLDTEGDKEENRTNNKHTRSFHRLKGMGSGKK